ncbi:MAG: endonuclease III [Candidatus Aenigmarchaeota archaeon]|nr:endonuclease III [Candidatus Aenigmarchaeota archaeon]
MFVKKQIIGIIVERLKRQYSSPKTTLIHKNQFELLIATVLSAQATDVSVNKVTPKLFCKYKGAKGFAKCSIKDIQKNINSINYYKTKAKRIKEISVLIENKFKSKVPHTMDELISLPGVGRKTANIVLSEGFGISEGIAVDTHVRRVSFRLGLTKNTDPLKIEQDLMKILPNSEWRNISIMLILHGRNTCSAKKPKCDLCVFNDICPSACNKQ